MALPLVTIAIPAYKAEFIQDSIKSALSQTYRNIEILIVDDCSPNKIHEKVALFNDSRLKYIRNKKNLGMEDPSKNWNECLKYSKGEYICILCDDDMYACNYIEELIRLAEKYPKCSAFRSSVSEIDVDGRVIDLYPLAPEHETIDEYIWHLYSGNNRQTLSEWMLKIDALRSIGGYVNSPMAWGADCMTVFKIAMDGGIVTSPKRMMSFRKSSINITGMEMYYIPQKILGWQMQCDCAKDIIKKGDYANSALIIDTVEKDRKQWVKHLIKKSSLIELYKMFRNRHIYRLSYNLLLKGFIYNMMYVLHIK